jgi:hypothetical protein
VVDRWHTDRVPLEILLAGPLLALAVLAVIAVAADFNTLRSRPLAAAPSAASDSEFGLLRTVALAANLASAAAVRDRLTARGIRATVGTDGAGFARVLVFADEYERARDAV